MSWLRRRPEPTRCEFVGGGLRCMRNTHEDGPHAQLPPIPPVIWNEAEGRWTLPTTTEGATP